MATELFVGTPPVVLILTVGHGLTGILLVAKACDKQPAVLVPDTVKLALLVGLTTAFPPCMV